MFRANRLSIAVLALSVALPPVLRAADAPEATPAASMAPGGIASYEEIPYYIRQLEQADQEGKRVEYDKIIHDAVVNADLSDRHVVKKMEPIMEKIRQAIDAKLDRPYLDEKSMWLGTAVAYYEREKGRPSLACPESDWVETQTSAPNGRAISTYPEKILLHENGKTRTAVESSHIHEALLSPDGNRIVFFRQEDKGTKAEIWSTNLKNLKRTKIATLPSCHTIVFSLDGEKIFAQEEPPGPSTESTVYVVSAGGGKPKAIGKASELATIVGKGRYKGNLVAYRLTPHHLGTTMLECAVILKPNGEELGKVAGNVCK